MTKRINVQCPNCGQGFAANVETVLDGGREPEAKMRLLSGRLNQQPCPRCGTPVQVSAPVVYHDGDKQLLITYVPMELNLNKDQQEKAVGELMRDLTASLPREAIKGYIFQPRQALTMQGLLDQVLQADGVTPEMMEEQRTRARLIETFARTAEEDLPALVAQYDEQIDARFLQLMTMMAQRMAQDGQRAAAMQIAQSQQAILEHSTFGKSLTARAAMQDVMLRSVSADLDGMRADADRADLLELAIRYATDADADEKLQALVGLVRPAMDNSFFQDLTARIGQAPAAERDTLEGLRDTLTEFTAAVDQQTQMVMQNAAQFLQAVMSSPDPDAMLRENADMIDDALMAVLTANVQELERRGDKVMAGRLRDLYNRIIGFLQSNMQPELRFVNDLLSMPSDDEARALLPEGVKQFGGALVEMMDAVEDILASRGETDMLERLAILRDEAASLGG
ncbi:MAG: CpXC domain-containing protein [Chloroflexota bacterium]|nr:CpXC domain-containing protein [Chloroflexota bacterium]